ncbi:lantibiotic dehydratase [Streptomonospora wellingtoniae]|uniref:Lantibiotic dehydratase n=1 Tax=Streptomonospora wellingtoniae TaxID=3075544 RepID=A0ABU2KWP2_9ACTN|nr:lantibiotic dehydratase [Streptomonospora sp. DSM 45055]MDT0303592.1 lantibiotic dehydratase [Streptomonospora sp. DSM 45055]
MAFHAQTPPAVRVAGVALSALTRLRCDTSHAEMLACLDARDDLAVAGRRLSDELYPVIGALGDHACKPGLVGLRRAVYQLRVPGEREWNPEIRARLPAALRNRVTAWLGALHDHHSRLAGLPATLESEIAEKRERLRAVTDDPHFLRALSLSSPALSEVLGKWHADPRRLPKRQSISQLVKYLARATTKTSPYSTFTVSGLGRWDPGAAATCYPAPGAAHCVLELDRPAFERVRDALANAPRLLPELTVRVNPSATVTGDDVRFLAPDSDEPVITVPASAAVLEVLRAVREHGPLTVADLGALLGRDHGNPQAARRFVDRLRTAGLLEAQLPVADQAERPFADLAGWLAEHAPTEFTSCGTLVGRVGEELGRAIPPADLDGHRARERTLRQAYAALDDAVRDLTGAAPASRPTALHESAVYGGAPVECANQEWAPALHDLNIARRWLALHDPAAPLRLVLGSFLRARFGPHARVPLLDLHRAVQEAIGSDATGFGRELKSAMDLAFRADQFMRWPSGLDRVRELQLLARKATQEILSSGVMADGTVEADPARLAALAETWPAWVVPQRSLLCYAQQVPVHGGPPWLVINSVTTGYGRARNRIHQQLRAAGETPVPLGVTEAEEGVVTAEFAGAFGIGLNRKQPTADYELDYPGAVTARPQNERLALGDLVVTLDTEHDLPRLESDALGAHVRPLHLGMMADSLLPPVARLITHVFGGTFLTNPEMALRGDTPYAGIPEEVVRGPRVRLGSVVLRRASWLVPVESVPVRGPHEQHADYLCRLIGWFREHRIPERCFVRPLTAAFFDAAQDPDALLPWVFSKSRKPQYVDAANPFLMDLIPRLAGEPQTGALLVTEALPDPADAPHDADGEQRVTEFVVEVSDA